MFSHDEQTIIAQCSPKGAGAIALLRLSGINAIQIADSIAFLNKKKLVDQPTHTIHYGKVNSIDNSIIDTVLFLLMKGPNSFTGQDTIEITCHNNPFIVEAIIQAAINAGARLAQEGEFAKRAVLNNKIDLVQAEAINELINANNQYTIKQSLAQLEGSFSCYLQDLEKKLIHALALTNASFEFIEEENIEFAQQISGLVTDIENKVAYLMQSFDQQKQIRSGIGISLIGSVNAGKSSLFNALIGYNRAIVTEQAGTTRDIVEAGFYKNGFYWMLADTAGLRQTNDSIEKEGIRRSYEQAAQADIILLIIDSARELSKDEKSIYEDIYHRYASKIIIVHNKSDLPSKSFFLRNEGFFCSMKDKESINLLKSNIDKKIVELFNSSNSPYLLNQRHYTRLFQLKKSLEPIKELLVQDAILYELVAYHLNEALALCSEILGKSVSEKAMDAVFKEFCIGK